MITRLIVRFIAASLILSSACTNEDTTYLKVTPRRVEGSHEVKLDLSFHSNRIESILLDLNAFSKLTAHDEDLDIAKLAVQEIVDSVTTAQLMIENANLERRFFSNIQLFEDETIGDISSHSIEDHFDTLKLAPDKPASWTTDAIDVNRLKIKPTDTKIRLYYLFNPSESQKAAGFQRVAIMSDWFDIK